MSTSLLQSHRFTPVVITAFVLILVLAGSFLLADYISKNGTSQAIVSQFGYVGVLVIAVIAGLNAIVPVPAASFVPVFLAAGLSMSLIILMLVIGTTIADLIGYVIGRWSRGYVAERYPISYQRVQHFHTRHRRLMFPFVFIYAAFVPFPNEAMLIPLALVGVRLRILIIPLVLGTTINQLLLAYGVNGLFGLFF